MANSDKHDHTVGQDGLVHHLRSGGEVKHDTGKSVPGGELAGTPQRYVDHAGRPTTVKEYKSGRVDVIVGSDQPNYWAKERIVEEARALATSSDWKATGERFRSLMDEWKSLGPTNKATDDRLWGQFDKSRKHFAESRQKYFDDRKKAQDLARLTKERIVSKAESLVHAADSKAAADEIKSLLAEWKVAGRADRAEEDRLWSRLDSARKRIQERRNQEFEKRKAEWSRNKAAKERLVSEAVALASSSDLKVAGEKMRLLGEEWKKVGPCEKADNDRLWSQFNAARGRLNEVKAKEFEKRKAEWASNRREKERLVAEASALASSSDLKAATDKMRALSDQWKRIGPCEKADNERLWASFNAARGKLNDAKKRQFDKRKAEYAANRASKERLVSRMSSLAMSSDIRAANAEARSLSDQWRAIGPCEKADNDRLWSAFKAAKESLRERANREFERAKRERQQRAWEQVSRLESQLANVEMAIIRANESYSRALSAKSPSFRNPNFASIVSNQNMRVSSARDKIISLGNRKNEIVNKLMAARSRANSI